MISQDMVREDLKDIRFYYIRKEIFDEANSMTGVIHDITKKAMKYNKLMETASPKLYIVYFYLYIKNYTQENFSDELGYSAEYVQRLNKSLISYLQKALSKETA